MNPFRGLFRLAAIPVKKGRSLYNELKEPSPDSESARSKKARILGIIGVVFLILVIFITAKTSGRKPKVYKKTEKSKRVSTTLRSSGDAFVAPSGDSSVLVKKMEEENYRLQQEINQLKSGLAEMKRNMQGVKSTQTRIINEINNLDEEISAKIIKAMRSDQVTQSRLEADKSGRMPGRPYVKSYQNIPLQKHRVSSVRPSVEGRPDKADVYLPLASWVKGTLLTGVYAPIDDSKPLPILVSIDEAFYSSGEKETRVPLKGCLAIGKATGNATTERTHIQLIKLSYVMDNGKVFETEGNLAFIVEAEGSDLGVKGTKISKTKEQMAAAFTAGAFAGAGAALERGQFSETTGPFGQIKTADTAATREIIGSGLNAAFTQMADYNIRQLEKLVDAIYVGAGRKIYIVMTQGVQIEGMEAFSSPRVSSDDYID